MILAGQIDKIEGERVWVLVSIDGAGCGDACNCERPVSKIEARYKEKDPIEVGETVILKSKSSAWSALVLLVAAIGGGILGFVLSGGIETTTQALVTTVSAIAGLVIGGILLSFSRESQFSAVEKVKVQLHSKES